MDDEVGLPIKIGIFISSSFLALKKRLYQRICCKQPGNSDQDDRDSASYPGPHDQGIGGRLAY
jgi:hypothetical protein